MNWGKGITIAIILFMLFIASFVYRAFQRSADLVREDYYEHELQFDSNKDAKQNYNNLKDSLKIVKMETGVCLQFPTSITTVKEGKIEFYRPDKKIYDRVFDLKLDVQNRQTLAYSSFKEGYYDITVRWSDHQKHYIFEDKIEF
ncbi:MAG: FixH family protein [Crocinitomicaceae bacterium]